MMPQNREQQANETPLPPIPYPQPNPRKHNYIVQIRDLKRGGEERAYKVIFLLYRKYIICWKSLLSC